MDIDFQILNLSFSAVRAVLVVAGMAAFVWWAASATRFICAAASGDLTGDKPVALGIAIAWRALTGIAILVLLFGTINSSGPRLTLDAPDNASRAHQNRAVTEPLPPLTKPTYTPPSADAIQKEMDVYTTETEERGSLPAD